jgi:hypothetical protein
MVVPAVVEPTGCESTMIPLIKSRGISKLSSMTMSMNPTFVKKPSSVAMDDSTATFRSSWKNMHSMYTKIRAVGHRSQTKIQSTPANTRKEGEGGSGGRQRQTVIEAVAVSTRTVDFLIALCFKKVDLLNKRSRVVFVLSTERALWCKLRNCWPGKWNSIFQVALRTFSQSVYSTLTR